MLLVVLAYLLLISGALLTFLAPFIVSKRGLSRSLGAKWKEDWLQVIESEKYTEEELASVEYRQLKEREGRFAPLNPFWVRAVLRVKLLGLLVALPGMLYILIFF